MKMAKTPASGDRCSVSYVGNTSQKHKALYSSDYRIRVITHPFLKELEGVSVESVVTGVTNEILSGQYPIFLPLSLLPLPQLYRLPIFRFQRPAFDMVAQFV